MRSIGLIVAMLLISPGAGAQEQTVENAQLFLQKALPGNNYIPATFSSTIASWIKNPLPYTQVSTKGAGRITAVSSPDRCQTAVFFDPSGLSVLIKSRTYDQTSRSMVWGGWEVSPENLAGALAAESYKVGKVAGAPTGFSWSHVIKVAVTENGTAVHVHFKGLSAPMLVELGAEDMATRVSYAMEFLRVNCDKTTGTGF